MISVLCVDDEKQLCELAKRTLEKTKEFTINTAGSAEAALEKVKTTSYDAIVSDYQMPGMDGIQLLKALRSSGITTPFILCIDHRNRDAVISAFENGADFYIGKDGDETLHFAELAHKIRAAVRHRRSEDTLIRSEEKYRAYTEHSPVGIFVVDPTGRYIDVNPAACRMLGYDRDELLRMHIADITPAERVASELERFNSTLIRTGKMSVEALLKKKDGTTITVILDATRLPDNTFMAFCTDITANKQTEEKLVFSNRMLGIALRAANAGTWDWDFPTGILTWSPEFFELFGLSPDAPPSFETWLSVLHRDDRQPAMVKIDQSVREHTPLWNEYRIILPDGTVRWIGAAGSTIYDDTGEPLRMSGVCIDISTRKQAETALRESEALLKRTGRIARVGGWELDAETLAVSWTEETFHIHEVPVGQTPPLEDTISFFHPDEKSRLTDAIRKALENGEGYDMELRFITAQGKHLWARTICEPEVVGGKTIRLIGTFQDITERKQAEEALADSENRFRDLFNNMGAGVAIYEPVGDGSDFIFRDINHAVEQIEQLRKEEVIGKSVLTVFPGIKEFGLFDVFQRVARTGVSERHPVSFYSDNRLTGWRENFVYKLPSGEIVSIYEDVTEKKQAEIALRESEELYREFFTTSRDCVFISSPDGHWIDFNETSLEMFGYGSREELMALPLQQLYEHPEDREKFLARIAREGYVREYPVRLRRRDGTVIEALITAESLHKSDGSIKAIVGSIRDITEQKAAGEALKKSEKNYKNLVENISDVLFSISPDGVFTYISPVVRKFGITADNVEGRPFSDFIMPDDLPLTDAAFREVLSGRERELEFRVRNPSGQIFFVQVSIHPEWAGGNVTGIAGIMTDITSLKDLKRLKVEALQKIDENLVEMAILNDQIRNPLAVIMAAADLTGGSTAEDIIRQVQEIDAMINKIDRKWVESEKVRGFLKKYYGVGYKA